MREGAFGGINPQMIGDVVISADTCHREAQDAGIPVENRFDQLLIHGILHLFGYDHVHSQSQARAMEAKSDELLALFRCPVDHTPLTRADAALVEQVNQAIRDGTLRNQLGETVTEPMQSAVVSENGQRLYPIHNGILTMIADEAIPWDSA